MSEEHAAEEVDITVFTSDSAVSADTLKDFMRAQGVDEIRKILSQYITNLKQGTFLSQLPLATSSVVVCGLSVSVWL